MLDEGADGHLAPQQRLSVVLDAARLGDLAGLREVDLLLNDFPGDPRLHFLRGSFLAGVQRYVEARSAMKVAVDLAPGYALARFQLGLLEVSSGDATAAEATWAPLTGRAPNDPLRLFALGLGRLIHDELELAATLLEEGVAANTDLPLLNRDMMMVVEEVRRRLKGNDEVENVSAAHLLLKQYSAKGPGH